MAARTAPRDRTSQAVAFGLVALALIGIAAVFGESLAAFVDPAATATPAPSPSHEAPTPPSSPSGSLPPVPSPP